MVCVFYLHGYICPNIHRKKFRLTVMLIFSIANVLLLIPYKALSPIYFFGEGKHAFLILLSTFLIYIGPMTQYITKLVLIANETNNPKEYIKRYLLNRIKQFPLDSVVYAPFLEEVLYRYCVCNMWEAYGISKIKIIFLSPIIFSLTHFHHIIEDFDRKIIVKLVIRSLFQCGFTCVFGWWNAFAWINTHGLFTAFSTHAFCNFWEFPDFKGAINFPDPKWRKVIIFSYLFGVTSFVVTLVVTCLIQ